MKDLECRGATASLPALLAGQSTGRFFCLLEAEDKESAMRVHREAHGLEADHIHEVVEGA